MRFLVFSKDLGIVRIRMLHGGRLICKNVDVGVDGDVPIAEFQIDLSVRQVIGFSPPPPQRSKKAGLSGLDRALWSGAYPCKPVAVESLGLAGRGSAVSP